MARRPIVIVLVPRGMQEPGVQPRRHVLQRRTLQTMVWTGICIVSTTVRLVGTRTIARVHVRGDFREHIVTNVALEGAAAGINV